MGGMGLLVVDKAARLGVVRLVINASGYERSRQACLS